MKVTAASTSDQAGARLLFAENTEKLQSVKKIWVDGTYRGEDWHKEVKRDYGIELEVSRNLGRSQGVCRGCQKMGCRENLRVEHSSPAIGARIRETSREQRSHDSFEYDSTVGQTFGLILFRLALRNLAFRSTLQLQIYLPTKAKRSRRQNFLQVS